MASSARILIKMTKARVKRRTSHEPNRMQMRKTLCSPSLSFISTRLSSCELRRLTSAREFSFEKNYFKPAALSTPSGPTVMLNDFYWSNLPFR